jgi:hypothetical protein
MAMAEPLADDWYLYSGRNDEVSMEALRDLGAPAAVSDSLVDYTHAVAADDDLVIDEFFEDDPDW